MNAIRSTVRLTDVASDAEVSKGTASLILNGKGDSFLKATRIRVLDAAARLNYVSDPLASARGRLANRQRFSEPRIGFVYRVVDGGFRAPYIFQTFAGLVEVLESHNGLVIPIPAHLDEGEEHHIPRLLRGHLIDGAVIMADALVGPIRHFLENKKVPMVFLDNETGLPQSSCVRIDDQGGGRAAAEHLLREGYPRIAVIAGELKVPSGDDRPDHMHRVEGAMLALQAAGISWDRKYMAEGGLDIAHGEIAAAELLDRLIPPIGIVCPNDRAALGALRECQRRGLRVPQDVGLVGFDDLVEITETTHPTLSSVRVAWDQLGSEAGNRIVGDLRDPDSPRTAVTCPVELVVRESSRFGEARS